MASFVAARPNAASGSGQFSNRFGFRNGVPELEKMRRSRYMSSLAESPVAEKPRDWDVFNRADASAAALGLALYMFIALSGGFFPRFLCPGERFRKSLTRLERR